MKLINRGRPISTISAAQYNRLVYGVEGMTGGEGVTVEKDSNGAITVKAGGGEYQLRAITVVAFEENDNGTVSLIFREVMALCTLPGGIVGQLDFGAETDAQGNLTAINIGTHRVPVEDCGEDNGGGVAM